MDGIPIIDGRPYPDATDVKVNDLAGHDFKVRMFRVPFVDGHKLSVVYGSCTYSDNYHHGVGGASFTETPRSVEVALIGDEGMIGEPSGYVSAPILRDFIERVRSGVADVRGLTGGVAS